MPSGRPLGMNWRCPDCKLPVIRARTEAMSWQLLDPVPNDAGNVHAYQANGNWHARSVPPRTPAVPPDALYMPHKATCPGKPADGPETPQEPPSGVAFLEQYRKADSGHKARQPAGRGRRRQAPAAGFRINPGGQR